jgi:drug/metabolite transporter (DMT)-like permease
MLVIFIPLKNKVKPSFRDLVFFAVLGFLGFFAYNVFLNEGEITVSAGIANFIIFQVPIIEILLATLFFGERINKIGFFGLIICMLGALAIAFANKEQMNYFGLFCIYIAAFSGAIYTAFQKKLLVKYHPIEAVSYFIWFGTLFLAIYSMSAVEKISTSSISDILIIVYMGVFPGALSYLLWGYAFKHVKISIASSALYVMPIFTLFMGWLFLDEIPQTLAIIITRYGVKK